MKAKFLFLMLFASTASFAQDDVYFDDVIERNTITKNILVEENEVVNYYHRKNVKVNHYFYSEPTRVPRCSRSVYRKPSTCNGYRRVEPQVNNYQPVTRSNKWTFFFDFNSAYLNNKEELSHLIDHAKYGSGNIYIDAYGDEATGDFYSNEEVAKRRANTIVNYLIKEGIDPGRMYVRYLGCTRQPYGNNNLNRCVIVKIG
jgi:outer membrane protein OmpA-like peptidoglycan-associated protein